ncbi:MAG: hypothetical protein ACYTGH_18120, partial [Planctomycetota bacterium]
EAITGFPRHEVIGRDCHEVFGGNFCGARCSFCESGKPPASSVSAAPPSTDSSTVRNNTFHHEGMKNMKKN